MVKVFKAKDFQVRTVEIKTSSGILKRPAVKVAVLDISKSSPAIYEGRNVDDAVTTSRT